MNTAILNYKNALLTPEARWLLMRWMFVFGTDQNVDLPLKTLFERLGLTYAQGRRGWNVLIAKHGERQEQFVEIERLPTKGRGRPRSRYRLSTKLAKALRMSPPASEHHAAEITMLAKTTLLAAENSAKDLIRDSRLRCSSLTISNRWLLMVLLAHADMQGVITSLGISKIRHLTGMSRSRIDRQLKKLVHLGVVAHHQPGRYSSEAKKRKTSIYLLDLAHPLLGKFINTLVTFSFPTSDTKFKTTELVDGMLDAVMTAEICSFQIDEILKGQNSIKSASRVESNETKNEVILGHDFYCKAQSHLEKFKKLKKTIYNALALLPSRRYLNGGITELLKSYDEKDVDWLLTSVHIDTCQLLTSSWDELKKGFLGPEQPCHEIIVETAYRLDLPLYFTEKKPGGETVVSFIERSYDLQAEGMKRSDSSIKSTPSAKLLSYPPLALLLYALSHHLAKCFQEILEQIKDLNFQAMSYMLFLVTTNSSDGQQSSAYQLRGYSYCSEDTNKEPRDFFGRALVISEDLKTYWRTHHKAYLSANVREPQEAAHGSSEFSEQ